MRLRITLVAFIGMAGATAQPAPVAPPDPEKQALAYQLQQCQQNALQTTTSTFALAGKLESETKRADTEKERADRAEAKLKTFEEQSGSQK